MKRSQIILLLTTFFLAGCGFSPVHQRSSEINLRLASVAVKIEHPNNIQTRLGQILEYALQKAINPGGISGENKYTLVIKYSEWQAVSSSNTDGSIVRKNVGIKINYQLKEEEGGKIISTGIQEVVDSFDTVASQYANYVAYNKLLEQSMVNVARQIKSTLIFALSQKDSNVG